MNHKLFQQISRVVSEHTLVPESEIFTYSRKQAVVDSRYLIMYISRHLEIKNIYIQRFFHAAGVEICYGILFHAFRRIEEGIKNDALTREVVTEIISQLKPNL